MMLYGNTQTTNHQDISVLAEILAFGIRAVNPSTGGNTGQVTLKITGSKFDPAMIIKLKHGTTVLVANQVQYVDRSLVFATFNLADTQTGMYDVIAKKSTGDSVALISGFQIVAGVPSNLSVYVVAPSSVRPNRTTSFTIEYANLGNTDIADPKATVLSQTASPIALSIAQLANLYHQLLVPLLEKNGPPGILRPGGTGSVTIYAKTTAGIGWFIKY
jgi:hypothetical protein